MTTPLRAAVVGVGYLGRFSFGRRIRGLTFAPLTLAFTETASLRMAQGVHS